MAVLDRATKEATSAFMVEVRRRFDVSTALLFGSRARRTHSSCSDADVAVILDGEPQSFAGTKLAMADIAFDVLLDTGVRIQPLPIWKRQWNDPEQFFNPPLIANIKRDGIDL